MDPVILKHRLEFAELIRAHATGPFRDVLPRLYADWSRWNKQFFEGKLVEPYILLTETSQARHLGDCAPITCFGSLLQIRIRPDIISGTHNLVKGGSRDSEGLYLLTSDILLHEMIHQYQIEVLQDSEESFKGHGPLFCKLCNEIGEVLGFEEVRPSKKSGPDKERPSCAYWPDNVRPDIASYYHGVLPAKRSDKPRLPKPKLQVGLADGPQQDEVPAEGDIVQDTAGSDKEVTGPPVEGLWLTLAKEAHRLSPAGQNALKQLQEQFAQ